jgi:hypothetical protein
LNEAAGEQEAFAQTQKAAAIADQHDVAINEQESSSRASHFIRIPPH